MFEARKNGKTKIIFKMDIDQTKTKTKEKHKTWGKTQTKESIKDTIPTTNKKGEQQRKTGNKLIQ